MATNGPVFDGTGVYVWAQTKRRAKTHRLLVWCQCERRAKVFDIGRVNGRNVESLHVGWLRVGVSAVRLLRTAGRRAHGVSQLPAITAATVAQVSAEDARARAQKKARQGLAGQSQHQTATSLRDSWDDYLVVRTPPYFSVPRVEN
jgi:hypothetical protein